MVRECEISGVMKASSGIDTDLYTKRKALGTVSLITPWNYPIAIPVWKLAPALATGNTVVLKPASEVPTIASMVFECLEETGLLPV